MLLVLNQIWAKAVPLSCPARGVLKNISLYSSTSDLRNFVCVASTVVKLFITLIHAELVSVRARHRNHTTRMSSLCESRNIFALGIIRSEWVVKDLDLILRHKWLEHEARLRSGGKLLSQLKLLDPCNFFFGLKCGAGLLVFVQIHYENHVPAKLALATVLRIVLRNWLVMVEFLQDQVLNFFLRSLILSNYLRILLLRVSGLDLSLVSYWLLTLQ